MIGNESRITSYGNAIGWCFSFSLSLFYPESITPLFFLVHISIAFLVLVYTFSDPDAPFLHPFIFFSQQLNKVLFTRFTFLSRKISHVLSFLLAHQKTFFLYIFDGFFHWMFKPEFLKGERRKKHVNRQSLRQRQR